jgi:hypothetical protein
MNIEEQEFSFIGLPIGHYAADIGSRKQIQNKNWNLNHVEFIIVLILESIEKEE